MNHLDPLEPNELLRVFVTTGSEDAFAALYLRLRPELRSFIAGTFSALKDDADDIVQDVFTRLHENPRSFWDPKSGQPSNACAILKVVAKRRALDELKRAGRRRETSLEEMQADNQTARLEAAMVQEHEQNRGLPSIPAMLKALEECPKVGPKDRHLLELEVAEETPTPERLAELSGTSVANVYQRRSRTRKHAAQRFGGVTGFLTTASRIIAWLRSGTEFFTMGRLLALSGLLALLAMLLHHRGKTSRIDPTVLAAEPTASQLQAVDMAPPSAGSPTAVLPAQPPTGFLPPDRIPAGLSNDSRSAGLPATGIPVEINVDLEVRSKGGPSEILIFHNGLGVTEQDDLRKSLSLIDLSFTNWGRLSFSRKGDYVFAGSLDSALSHVVVFTPWVDRKEQEATEGAVKFNEDPQLKLADTAEQLCKALNAKSSFGQFRAVGLPPSDFALQSSTSTNFSRFRVVGLPTNAFALQSSTPTSEAFRRAQDRLNRRIWVQFPTP